MTKSFWIALVLPTPVVGGLPPDVMLKVLLSSISNPAQHSSGHRGETCLCVYVFIPSGGGTSGSSLPGVHWGDVDEASAEEQRWIDDEDGWSSGDGQDLAHPVRSYFHTGWYFDTVISQDSRRETGVERLDLSKCQILNMISEPRKLRTEKTLECFFFFQNAARPVLLAPCEYLRQPVFAFFPSLEQDLALLWARRALKMVSADSSVTRSTCWQQ